MQMVGAYAYSLMETRAAARVGLSPTLLPPWCAVTVQDFLERYEVGETVGVGGEEEGVGSKGEGQGQRRDDRVDR